MALIKFGNITADVRGSIGGTTYSRNTYGAYARSKISPVHPISSPNENSKQSFKAVSQAWASSLTDAERAAWIAFAATHTITNVFGDTITMSGIAMFQALAKRQIQLGFPIIADPPASLDVLAPGAISALIAVNSGPSMSIIITPTVNPGGTPVTAYLWATKAIAPGRNPVKTDYRLINDFSASIYDETEDFGPQYLARFNPYVPAVGDKIGLLYCYLDSETGAISIVSALTQLTTGVPGPIMQIVQAFSPATGAGTDVILWTPTPHGLSIGNTAQITSLVSASVTYTGAQTVQAVPSPDSIMVQLTTTGTDASPVTATGTVQRQ